MVISGSRRLYKVLIHQIEDQEFLSCWPMCSDGSLVDLTGTDGLTWRFGLINPGTRKEKLYFEPNRFQIDLEAMQAVEAAMMFLGWTTGIPQGIQPQSGRTKAMPGDARYDQIWVKMLLPQKSKSVANLWHTVTRQEPRIYHTCAAIEPDSSSTARLSSCQEGYGRHASLVGGLGLDEWIGQPWIVGCKSQWFKSTCDWPSSIPLLKKAQFFWAFLIFLRHRPGRSWKHHPDPPRCGACPIGSSGSQEGKLLSDSLSLYGGRGHRASLLFGAPQGILNSSWPPIWFIYVVI